MHTEPSVTNRWVAQLPNQLTILRIILTPVFIALVFSTGYEYKLLALIVFILASTSDAYDGYIARKYNLVTPQGKFLDPLADKILVLSAFVSFWAMEFYPLWMLVLIILRDVFITGLRLWMIRKDETMETSIVGKSKTAVQMVGIYVILVFLLVREWAVFDFLNPVARWIDRADAIWWMMLVVTLMTFGSGLHYLYVNRRLLRQRTSR